MEKFRLPRKIKKQLGKDIWLYPADEKGSSLMAWPKKNQKDYTAIKQGIIRSIIDRKNSNASRKAYWEKLNREITVTDEDLKKRVDEIFLEKYRRTACNTLILAKNNPKAIIAYYNFLNAYNDYRNGQDSGNACCHAVDTAKELLKK